MDPPVTASRPAGAASRIRRSASVRAGASALRGGGFGRTGREGARLASVNRLSRKLLRLAVAVAILLAAQSAGVAPVGEAR